jgi:hypothetical protein
MNTVLRAAVAVTLSFFVLAARPHASLAQQDAPPALQNDSGQQQIDPDHLKAAEELMAVGADEHQTQLIQQLTTILWPELQLGLRAKGLDQLTVDGIREDYAAAFSSMILDLVRETEAQIIAQHFTTQELRDLTALESTPLARKYQAEAPGILADAAKAALSRKGEIEKRLNASLQEILTSHGYCASHPKQCP